MTEIEVKEKFADALNAIEDYSHVMIIYWMDKVNECNITHRPQGNLEVPVVGIFSCRCPPRPNPIGVSIVKLVSHKGNRIMIQGLDILDNTPIIDIKPYWPVYDEVKDAKVPDWVGKLDI